LPLTHCARGRNCDSCPNCERAYSTDRRVTQRPSSSTSSFGGVPRDSIPTHPVRPVSRQTMTILPAGSLECHSLMTFQTRDRTPFVISGAMYTPAAISNMTDARNPRKRSAASRVTITVSDIASFHLQNLLNAVDHRRYDIFLAEYVGCLSPY